MPKIVDWEERRILILNKAIVAFNNKENVIQYTTRQSNLSRTSFYGCYSDVKELQEDLNDSLFLIDDKIEVVKYKLNNFHITNEQYMQIYEILEGVTHG